MINSIRSCGFALLLTIVVSCGHHTDREPNVFSPDHKYLLLMHPTTNNIRTINYLITEGIFPLPENYHILGVYHQSSTYNFELSQACINELELTRFSLLGIGQTLTKDMLFQANSLTDTFRLLFEQSEGAIFMGGPDMVPAAYGEPVNLLTVIEDAHRHFFELSFLFHMLGGHQDVAFTPMLQEDPFYRILGICLGMQTMNVATGGTMIQDIPSEVYGLTTVEEVLAMDENQRHRNYYTNLGQDTDLVRYNFHQIITHTQSQLQQMVFHPGTKPVVLSSHHQALKDIGKGFRVTAWSVDSLIPEAIEHEKYPNVFGVQFHPEVITLYQPDAKLKFKPQEEPLQAYLDLYPGDLGAHFHRGFWKHTGLQYP
jgi:putative glutamine amidotransferase